jgi:hypothetical protein
MTDLVLALMVLTMWAALLGVAYGLGWLILKLTHKITGE